MPPKVTKKYADGNPKYK